MEIKIPSEAVLQESDELTRRIVELCMENNMAVAVGHSYILSRDENGCTYQRNISAYVDEKAGAYNPSIAAAAQMLKIRNIPREVIVMLSEFAQFSNQQPGVFDAGERVH
ncbi:hypothetical protein DPO11_22990 [Salmonella enterica]|nr:hypothetical protein [Salmonella enterica]